MRFRTLFVLSIALAVGCSADSEPTPQQQLLRITKQLNQSASSQQASYWLDELSQLIPRLSELPRSLLPRVCEILGDKDFNERDAGAQCILAFGQSVGDDLLALVDDKQVETRRGALCALDFLSKDAWDTVPAKTIGERLEALIDSEKDPKLRSLAIRTLARVSRDYEHALERGLRDPDRNVRMSFASAYERHTPKSDKVFELLAGRIRDPQEYVYARANCMGSLGRLFRARAVPVLLERLSDRSIMAESAIGSLGSLQGDAKEAVPDLLRALENRPELRLPAAKALGEIRCEQSAEVVERIATMIVDGRLNHSEIEQPLAKIAPANFPALINVLVADDGSIRLMVQRVLNTGTRRVRENEALAVFVIANTFGDERPAVRRVIGDCQFVRPVDVTAGPELDAAIKSLTRALKHDDDPKLRQLAAVILNLMRGPTTSSLPALIAALEDKEPTVRRAALDAIGDMGAQATEAVPALQRIKDGDPDDFVRRQSDFAIMKIHGGYPTIDELKHHLTKEMGY